MKQKSLTSAATPKKAVNLESFRAQVDDDVRHPALIRKGLAAMMAEHGKEAHEVEQDFLKRCRGVGNSNITRMRPLFAGHIIIAKPDGKNEKRYWFADKTAAAKAAKIRGIRFWTSTDVEE